MPITFRIWHRSWVESIAIRQLDAYKKRKSNYFFQRDLPYPENEVMKITNESLPSIYHTLKVWGAATGYGTDIRELHNISRKFFDYNMGFFFIEKIRKEISQAKK
jgi:predicted transcriptional regulator